MLLNSSSQPGDLYTCCRAASNLVANTIKSSLQSLLKRIWRAEHSSVWRFAESSPGVESCSHLVQLVLLGERDCLSPAQIRLVDVRCDAPELHQVVPLQPRGQPNLHQQPFPNAQTREVFVSSSRMAKTGRAVRRELFQVMALHQRWQLSMQQEQGHSTERCYVFEAAGRNARPKCITMCCQGMPQRTWS